MKNVKAILKQKQIGVSYSSKSETVLKMFFLFLRLFYLSFTEGVYLIYILVWRGRVETIPI